ncbi:MAG: DNA-processing protein DprA [Negativicutes bacterium]|nr:DNA-processing protein DprA [Negativicutes bacterium]
MEKTYRAALLSIPGIGNARARVLIDYFGDAQTVWRATQAEIAASRLLDGETCNKLINSREKIDIYKLANNWSKKGIKLCSFDCPEYPAALRTIFDAPQILFYRGSLPEHQLLIAVVGSRKATAYGKNVASMLAKQLAEAGCWVVSGAARGIDTAAHEGALVAGSTIAVLGNGINIAYPPENAKLLARIAEQGALISEYPPDTPPVPAHFPARNRIINGLSRGVVIVEAAEKSGALITADFALEEGRDVFAVPGSVFSETSKGCNRLIKQGAKLVDSVADILDEYGIQNQAIPQESPLTNDENTVYRLLSHETPIGLEQLAAASGLTAQQLTYILLQLELRGLASRQGGQQFVRNAGRKSP